MNKLTALIIGVIAIIAVLYLISQKEPGTSDGYVATSTQNVINNNNTNATSTPLVSVENHVRANISALSTVKEQVGGKFYVTNITAQNGTGNVSYDDGHNAYTADFTYVADISGVTITSFKVRP